MLVNVGWACGEPSAAVWLGLCLADAHIARHAILRGMRIVCVCGTCAVAARRFARILSEADFVKTEITSVQLPPVDRDNPDETYYSRMVPMPRTRAVSTPSSSDVIHRRNN